MEILVINGHDYTSFVESKGYGWSREDLDSEKTTRTKDGKLRRDKIGTKRKLSYNMFHMPRAPLAQLDDAFSQPTFSSTYYHLHGPLPKTFYYFSFPAPLPPTSHDTFARHTHTFTSLTVGPCPTTERTVENLVPYAKHC